MVQSRGFNITHKTIGNENIGSPQQSRRELFNESQLYKARSILAGILQLVIPFVMNGLDDTNNFIKITISIQWSHTPAEN